MALVREDFFSGKIRFRGKVRWKRRNVYEDYHLLITSFSFQGSTICETLFLTEAKRVNGIEHKSGTGNNLREKSELQ